MTRNDAFAYGSGNIIVQVAGDANSVHVNGGPRPQLRLIPVARRLCSQPARDIQLLDPAFRATPLIGREEDLQRLHSWLRTQRPISIRTITGPAGSGKTRLAFELLVDLAYGCNASALRWDAGFLTRTEAERFVRGGNLTQWGWEKPTLIIIDYAATLASVLRPWFRELADSPQAQSSTDEAVPLRFLLLERNARIDDGWYGSLVSGDWQSHRVHDWFDPRESVSLTPINSAAHRYRIFRSGLEWAAAKRGVSVPVPPHPGQDLAFDQRLSHPQWRDPLLLLMAGLVSLDTGTATALSLARTDISMELAKREGARVRALAPDDNRGAADLLLNMVALATICGGLAHDEALHLASELQTAMGLEYPDGYRLLVDDLRDVLPSTSTWIDPIRPNLLGEGFLLQVWKSPDVPALRLAAKLDPDSVAFMLVRTAQDFVSNDECRPTDWLGIFIQDKPGVIDFKMLWQLVCALPEDTAALAGFAGLLTDLLATAIDHFRSDLPELTEVWAPEHALLLSRLAVWQRRLGHYDLALSSIEAAIRIHTLDSKPNGDFLPLMATLLNNLSNCQSCVGSIGTP